VDFAGQMNLEFKILTSLSFKECPGIIFMYFRIYNFKYLQKVFLKIIH